MDFKRCTVGGVDYSPTDDSALYEATGKDNDSTATADAEVFPLDNSGFLGMVCTVSLQLFTNKLTIRTTFLVAK